MSLLNEADAQRSQYFDLRRYIGKTEILDSAKLRVDYSLSYIRDTLNLSKISRDRKVLLIGDKINKFYSYYVQESDSVLTADWNKGKNSARVKRSPDILGEGYELYCNYPEGKRTIVNSITSLSVYKYEEDVENPRWVIRSETTVILGYFCIKATGRIGARDYEVWFTPSIPIQLGPWKLAGLPGLILKAYDTKKHYTFECIGIEQLKQKQPIVMPQWAYINTTKEEYKKNERQFYNDYVTALLSLGFNVNITDGEGNRKISLETPNRYFADRNISHSTNIDERDRYKKLPYNPIELE
jgi:GLPGLI family protein